LPVTLEDQKRLWESLNYNIRAVKYMAGSDYFGLRNGIPFAALLGIRRQASHTTFSEMLDGWIKEGQRMPLPSKAGKMQLPPLFRQDYQPGGAASTLFILGALTTFDLNNRAGIVDRFLAGHGSALQPALAVAFNSTRTGSFSEESSAISLLEKSGKKIPEYLNFSSGEVNQKMVDEFIRKFRHGMFFDIGNFIIGNDDPLVEANLSKEDIAERIMRAKKAAAKAKGDEHKDDPYFINYYKRPDYRLPRFPHKNSMLERIQTIFKKYTTSIINISDRFPIVGVVFYRV